MALVISGLPSGVAALLLLLFLVCSVVVAMRAFKLSPCLVKSASNPVDVRRFYSLTSTTMALPFWVWAMGNTIQDGAFDLGILSFFTVMVGTAIFVATGGRRGFLTVVVGSAFVSVNYLLGLIVLPMRRDVPWTLLFYFAVAAGVWAAVGAVGMSVHRRDAPTVQYTPVETEDEQ